MQGALDQSVLGTWAHDGAGGTLLTAVVRSGHPSEVTLSSLCLARGLGQQGCGLWARWPLIWL